MKQISKRQLQKKLTGDDELFLLDVREESEHEEFNIGGTLIPLAEVIGKASEIPMDRPVVVYCRKGIRSQIAIQRLEEKFGFTNLLNLDGGIEQWSF
ncbi:MAG TPA: rhodanese-like domain-containing protein [Segetibacter sp.]|nr:rhodanese-like domain-containing protein [Segetibacter sp.]